MIPLFGIILMKPSQEHEIDATCGISFVFLMNLGGSFRSETGASSSPFVQLFTIQFNCSILQAQLSALTLYNPLEKKQII